MNEQSKKNNNNKNEKNENKLRHSNKNNNKKKLQSIYIIDFSLSIFERCFFFINFELNSIFTHIHFFSQS